MAARLCLDCRAVLAEGETCGLKHRALRLGDTQERAKAVDEVWGPPSLRRKARELARAGAAGASAGGIGQAAGCIDVADCGGSSLSNAEGLVAIAVVLAAALVGMILYWSIRAIVRWARERANRLRPNGALVAFPALPSGEGVEGVIEGKLEVPAPLLGVSVVAFDLELRDRDAVTRETTLRDGRTDGFAVRADDGRVVRVPAGRLRIEGGARRETDAMALTNLEDYLRKIDPARGTGDDFPPIPFDEAREATLWPGDRVRVLGALDTVPDPAAQAGGYRESAMALAPVGLTAIRLVKASER